MIGDGSRLAGAFATAMAGLGPFEPCPALAVAVSGGADSMALTILANDWVRRQNGSVLAFVVDHGLRPASANEALITLERLDRLGVAARLLRLTTLSSGPALAERARIMRYQALSDACRDTGRLHLLLGHHAADQVETLAMRALRGSQTHGLAAMAALRETATLRLLRPLLDVQPEELRRFLVGRAVDWVEDPSNRDLYALRSRLRQGFAAQNMQQTRLPQAISAVGLLRAREEAQIACELAVRATIRPEGFAVLSPAYGPIGAAALSSLVRTLGGSPYPPRPLSNIGPAQLVELAKRPRAATIGGVRLILLRDRMLVVREEAAIADAIAASPGALWDNRFRVTACEGLPDSATIGKLGNDAPRVRSRSDLPSAVLRTLPAIRIGEKLAIVPHIGYVDIVRDPRVSVIFSPPGPVAGASFVPAASA
jgi:tRNA(Ile)-lysidine synthase